MGCDIHMHVEFKRPNWHKDAGWKCGDYFTIVDPTDPGCEPIYEGLLERRSYSLFAVLADVRNRGYPYISEPKGLPADATEFVKKEYDSWGYDAHSCSYLTLREIVEFDRKEHPLNIFGEPILRPLVERLVRRADELNVLYDFEMGRELTDEVLKKIENIRIVFWFDN